MNIVRSNGRILARHVTAEDIAEGLSFFSEPEDFVQVGSWLYGNGKDLKRHIHNEVPRQVTRTQEVLVVISGAVRAAIYDEAGALADSLTVKAGEVLILLGGGHGYDVLQDQTRVIEIKNGPYPGAERDRRRF
jgi:hypothetical protein